MRAGRGRSWGCGAFPPGFGDGSLGADPRRGHGQSEQTGGSQPGVHTAPVAPALSKHGLCCGRSRWGLLLPWGEAPAPGAVTGSVRVGVSLPSRAGQTLLQPLNGALELPPHAFVPCQAVFGIAYVCLCFGITPEGLSLHLTPQRAKNGVRAKQLAPTAVCWVGTAGCPLCPVNDALLLWSGSRMQECFSTSGASDLSFPL